jgi:hypothetical protein
MTSRQLKVRNEIMREKMHVTQNFGKTGQQYVEMAWTRSTDGG